jgi:hypothetical protein
METQEVINVLLGLLCALLGWLMNELWTAVKDLRTADEELVTRITSIEILVAGQYVTREELDRKFDVLFTKFDDLHQTVLQSLSK